MSQAKIKPAENALFATFSGLDTRSAHTGTPSMADIYNFRLTADGSLEKRYGYRYLAHLGGDIRAVWSGKLGERFVCVALGGSAVSTVNINNGEVDVIGNIDSSEGGACFFYHHDRLYLLAGGLYVIDVSEPCVKRSFGYIPLIGKDWGTKGLGEIFEPMNLLSDRARISYLIEDDHTSFLHLGEPIESINSVYLNGELLPEDGYIYDEDYNAVRISGLSPNDRILIYVTYQPSEERATHVSALGSCRATSLYQGIGSKRVLAYGGSAKNLIFISSYVPPESMSGSIEAEKESDSLYFPFGCDFTVGDGRSDITGITRHYDRLLIFTESDTWSFEGMDGGEVPSLRSVNPVVGCKPFGAFATAENSPVTVGERAIYEWNAQTDEYNECNAKSISAPIASLLGSSFYADARAFLDRKHSELWFYSKSSGYTAVYSIPLGGWVRFLGFELDGFFDADGEVGFYRDNRMYIFDPSLEYDLDESGTQLQIHASLKSNLLEFGTVKKKKLSSLSVRADQCGKPIRVRISVNGTRMQNHTLYASGTHSADHKRLSSGRFDYAQITLIADSTVTQRIHSLLLCAS